MTNADFVNLPNGTVIEHINGKYYSLGDVASALEVPGNTTTWRQARQVASLTPLVLDPNRHSDITLNSYEVSRAVTTLTTATIATRH